MRHPTPIYCAYENRHKDAIILLIELGANTDTIMSNAVGSRHSDVDMLTLLLNCGVNPNIMARIYYTNIPLNIAIIYNNINTVKLLLEYDADIEIVDQFNSNKRPLEIACKESKLTIFKYLITRGAIVDKSQDLLLRSSCDPSRHIIFKYILDNELNTPTIDTLKYVLIKGNIKCAAFLLDKGINPNILAIGDYIKLPHRKHALSSLSLLQSYGATGLRIINYGVVIKRVSE